MFSAETNADYISFHYNALHAVWQYTMMEFMADVDLSAYKSVYLETCEEYRQKIDVNLKTLIDDKNNHEAVEEIHRAVHSLKSSSFIMGFVKTAIFCSQVENIFYEIKMNTIIITEDLLNLFIETFKDLSKSLEMIKNQNTELDLTVDLQRLGQATGIKSSISNL